MTAQCLISFGSNLGNRDSLIAEASRLIAADSSVHGLKTSRLFETPPIGGPGGQEPFLNAVAAFETADSARQILGLLQEIEERLGRQRRQRWDARSIDLDVVLHGELVGGGTGLIVPHPRYTARQFVLQPACDVAAHYRDPRFGWTIERLARHLGEGVPSLALVGGDGAIRNELCRRLRDEQGIQTFAAEPLAAPMAVVGNAPAARQQAGETSEDSLDEPGKTHAANRQREESPALGFRIHSAAAAARQRRDKSPQRSPLGRPHAIGHARDTLACSAPDVACRLAVAGISIGN